MKKSTDMKLKIFMMTVSSVLMFMGVCAEASAQQQEEAPDIYEQAEMEADRLQRVLDLEDWQTFYVDSTLKHDFPAMMAEYEQLRLSKISNTNMYRMSVTSGLIRLTRHTRGFLLKNSGRLT